MCVSCFIPVVCMNSVSWSADGCVSCFIHVAGMTSVSWSADGWNQ